MAMQPKCPRLLDTAIVTDDPLLAARFSSAVARKYSYFAVLDGPRLSRDDADAEIIHRINALARIEAKEVILSGLTEAAATAMMSRLPRRGVRLYGLEDASKLASDDRASRKPLRWGRNFVGVGLLKSLYENRLIEFEEGESPLSMTHGPTDHLVICEAGEPLSEVIAANYAFSLGASLCVIPQVDEAEARELLESFYSIDDTGRPQSETRKRLLARLRELCENIKLPRSGSLTVFTRKLPFGVAFPELPSTHLFTYPDAGVAVVNGFAAEQSGTRGVNVAVLVDPEKTRAPEIKAATSILPKRKMFVRGYRGSGATVSAITEMVDLFPYDLLVFATHCGDASGYRWTYQFTDSEGRERELVVDIAIGIGATKDPDLLSVMQFMRFHSLDGVDWNDPVAKAKLRVGTAIRDFMDRRRREDLEPVRKESVDRVRMSAAMAMHDHNYIAMPRALADQGSPIVINNACVSWHELSVRFTFAGARAYIGTLYPVSDLEAESVVIQLFERYWGKYLPHALWSAQNSTYGDGNRRPYVVTGVYPQRLRVTRENVPLHILKRLIAARAAWKKRLGSIEDESARKKIQEFVNYYQLEAKSCEANWFSQSSGA